MSRKFSLNGTWRMRWTDGQRGGSISRLTGPQPELLDRTLEAMVPGEVHLDLLRAGWIDEPTVGRNCLTNRWVEECLWYYRRTFDAPSLGPGERAQLVFETLDLAAVVYLNGKEVGRHANAFYPCRLDVTEHLREGENILAVELDGGLFHVADKPYTGYNLRTHNKLHKRHWLRKTQSTFSWDWSARLINVGISGDVTLEIFDGVQAEGLVALADLSADLSSGTVTARVITRNTLAEKQPATLTVEIVPPAGDDACSLRQTAEVEIPPGQGKVEWKLHVDRPRPWWPVGHGQQPLYTVRIGLQCRGQVVVEGEKRVGFRHVRVNQDKHPVSGRYFVIEVNGKPIFLKGGNFVPAEMILARLNRKRYETLVDRALEANFNCLRIWGGGLYESDDFYDICDERGVLVWQEFIFACATYPGTDEQFLADVKCEATYQVRRLGHHASLIVWCGNNEIEMGEHSWGYERGVAHCGYAIFHMALPIIVQNEDGTRYYQPSSPFSPDHADPNRDDVGDQHPWSIGFANTDFREYRKMICRFPNEGGILGPTALPTVRACLEDGVDRPGTLAWELHDNSTASWGDSVHPDAMLVQWLGMPLQSMTIEDYVYYGGIVQGEGLTEYIRNFRRRMFDSASAVFWMYNDCWPAVRSWTIVDYYLRRTPAFYPVRRAFQPLTVSLAHEDGKVRVFVVNDGEEWRGQVRFGLFALAGGLPRDDHKAVCAAENASTLVAEFDASQWERLGETTHGAFAVLQDADGREVARDRLFLPLFKEMVWPKANLKVNCRRGKATFTSDTFAWRVCLDLDGRLLSDNFFDVLPGIPTEIDWPDHCGEPRVLRVGNLGPR